MLSEFGSEFWDTKPRYIGYFLSGRTALDYIIKEILVTHKIVSVLLPSYCCHTMITPFLKNGISVRFYDVYFDDKYGLCVNIPESKKHEIFYYMTYFGYQRLTGINLECIRKQWEITIEDKTHSWLSWPHKCEMDYSFISFRKWSDFTGIAKVEKKKGPFLIEYPKLTNIEYCSLRKEAFALKQKYIIENVGEKSEFLSLFSRAEELLELDYVGYQPHEDSYEKLANTDFLQLRKKRRQNAEVLIKGINNIFDIHLINNKLEEGDTPLFVPIVVEKDRDLLQKHLIANKVYCPVHWPISDYHKGISHKAKRLYQQELSIICDQRYDIDDMEYIIKLIKRYFT